MFTIFRRIISLGWQNLARDSGIAVANVFIIMIPILLTSTLFFVKDISAYLIEDIQEKVDISVYFNDSVPEDGILKVKDKITQIPGVIKVEEISKETALANFSERHKDNPGIIESLQEVNGNPLLPSLNISAESTVQFQQVSDLLGQQDYKDLINKVNYKEKKDIIEKIFSLTDNVQKIGLLLFAVLGIISIMVTFNTVRMAILSHGVEIGIQRLVGASRWFLRGQFLVEGLIFGLLAAALSMLIVAAVCYYLTPSIATLLPGMNLWQNFTNNLWLLAALQAAIGALLGTFSSLIAISRYLKV